jgi:hypothetical protein
MALPAPNLDTRQFQDLMNEAQERIPRYAPEWTNFNPSDPGMALVQLYAWLSETILYDLNRVPDLNYIKFLNLLGVTPRPAQPARAEVSFVMEDLPKPNDPLVINVPMGTAIAVDDPDLEQALTFETDRSLVGLNAHIGAAIAAQTTGDQSRRLVTRYDEGTTWLHAFDPFGATPANDACFYIGLLLRPVIDGDITDYSEDTWPAGPLDLQFDAVQVYDKLNDTEVLEGPLAWECASSSTSPDGPLIEWHAYTGSDDSDSFPSDSNDDGWTPLAASRDDTLGLSRTGHVVLEMPAGATAVDPALITAEFWKDLGEVRPPRTQAELAQVLRQGDIADISKITEDMWAQMGLAIPVNPAEGTPEAGLLACLNTAADMAEKLNPVENTDGDPNNDIPAAVEGVDPTKLTLAQWIEIDPRFGADLAQADDKYRKLYWLRARVRRTPNDEDQLPLMMQAVRLNTAPATQAATVREERLGVATGRPAQTVSLRKKPVLIHPATNAPDLSLTLSGADGLPVEWLRVDDFYRSGPADIHYILDPITGQIGFGDGRNGQIPVAGSKITAAQYRIGGGAIGNVSAATITKIKGRVRGVKEASNFRPAHDGEDAETVEAAKARAPHDLRNRDRAVSAEDFRDLAMQTPGVNLHKVFALSRRAVDSDEVIFEKDGSVTLLVLPNNDDPAPQPSQTQHRAICKWLEPRRLITTELHVVGPRYSDVTTLSANVTVKDGFDLSAVNDAIYARLLDFMHPIKGGVDGTGWPFGGAIYHGDLYDQMLGVEGVRRVTKLMVALDGAAAQTLNDYNNLAEGHLPVLTRDVIKLVPSYA